MFLSDFIDLFLALQSYNKLWNCSTCLISRSVFSIVQNLIIIFLNISFSLVCAVSYTTQAGEKMYFRKFFKFQVQYKAFYSICKKWVNSLCFKSTFTRYYVFDTWIDRSYCFKLHELMVYNYCAGKDFRSNRYYFFSLIAKEKSISNLFIAANFMIFLERINYCLVWHI